MKLNVKLLVYQACICQKVIDFAYLKIAGYDALILYFRKTLQQEVLNFDLFVAVILLLLF